MKHNQTASVTNCDTLGTILLIDDEPQILRVYKSILTAEKFSVDTATSFAEAIQSIDQKEYHLILTDLRMSDKTGIELIQEIRQKGVASEVVVITGYPELETARDAMRYGALDYLTKPVFKDDLLRVCHYAVDHYRLKKKKAALEHHMAAMMRSMQDGVMVLDGNKHLLFANAAAVQLCAMAEPFVGVPVEQGLQRTASQLKNAILSFLAQGDGPAVTIPVSTTTTVTLSSQPLLDNYDRPLGTILVLKGGIPATVKPQATPALPGIIGNCPAMQRAFHLVECLAGLDTTVLITGESGTGKELIAEALHKLGHRKNQPFIAVNCAAIPDTLLESELFGHTRGSFTGAVRDHAGKLQQADRGTIFLDEIGDTSPAMQVRLLRFLEKKEIQRLGEERTIQVNTRIITATNRDLAAKVRENSFRQDLYYRLKVVEIHLPPLRERREDLPALVAHYLDHFSKKFNKRLTRLAPEVHDLFQSHTWPGNIRELIHVLERAAILTHGESVTLDAISLDTPAELSPVSPVSAPEPPAGPFDTYKLNRDILVKVLEKNRWNVTDAARELGVSRTTIYRKMEEFGIDK